MSNRKKIFLSYSHKDKTQVLKLYKKLTAAGFQPWMDRENLYPGEKWLKRIKFEIKQADFFIVCLTNNSIDERSFVKDEVEIALKILQKKYKNDIYLIPVRLEECEVPAVLSEFNWVDLFKRNGWIQLLRTIRAKVKRHEQNERVILTKSEAKERELTELNKRRQIMKNKLSLKRLAVFQKLDEFVYRTRNTARSIFLGLKKQKKIDRETLKSLTYTKGLLSEYILEEKYYLDLFSCFDVIHDYKNVLIAFHALFPQKQHLNSVDINEVESGYNALDDAYFSVMRYLESSDVEQNDDVLLDKKMELARLTVEMVYRLKHSAKELCNDFQLIRKVTLKNKIAFLKLFKSFEELIYRERFYFDLFSYFDIVHHYKSLVDEFSEPLLNVKNSQRPDPKEIQERYGALESNYKIVTKHIKIASGF